MSLALMFSKLGAVFQAAICAPVVRNLYNLSTRSPQMALDAIQVDSRRSTIPYRIEIYAMGLVISRNSTN